MKRCPVCRRVYDHGSVVCRVDGTALGETGVHAAPTVTPRYRVIRRLGGSRLGAVYLAEEVAAGQQVAVKVLLSEIPRDVELVKQFWWEARLAAASSPSHIVRVYEVDRTDEGRVFIAMEYLEGESLAAVIQRQGALEPRRALRLAIQIAQGLAAASQAGVTHHNLKPQNVIVVGPEEQIKLTDFGVARLRETALGGRSSGPGLIAPEYVAPEQLRGDDVSFRADIYALGAVLYTMLTGAAPAQHVTPVRMLRPDLPEALEQFVMRAMERRPERRPGGIEEVIGRLQALAAAEPVLPPEREPELPPSPFAEWRLLALELRDHVRADVWRPGLGRLRQASVDGYARLRASLHRCWSRRGKLLVIGVAALGAVGITEAAFLDWWSAVRAQALSASGIPTANERGQGRDPEAEALTRPTRLFRVRTQVQQRLYRHGLFRVSTADRWGVTLEIGSRGEVILSGLLPDMALYHEALQLVRQVPGVGEVQAADLRVAEAGG